MSYRLVFKIFRTAEWKSFAASGSFAGAPDDVRDGFIHMSYAAQVSGTLERHFANDKEIVLAAFDETVLGAALKAERSRGDVLFPHLYGPLTRAGLKAFARITRTHQGFELPEWCA